MIKDFKAILYDFSGKITAIVCWALGVSVKLS